MRIEKGRVCVYTHSCDGIVFYVGKGVCYRPFETSRRNERWRSIVDESGVFDVDILGWFDSDTDACARELQEIRSRKPVANLMNNGWKRPESFRNIVSKTHKGKSLSVGTRAKISKARIGKKGWNRGTPPTADHRQKLIDSAHKRAVIDTSTGQVYESIREAARSLGILKDGIQNNLGGRQKTVNGRVFTYALGESAASKQNCMLTL